uniref:Ferric reductase NAD binding domain-containing protein n=1 Tax=Spongospora subterranea TaxID=70186 RepID=A0A0H5QPW1_9EUKA|eukprot:CRZ03652.1 hypothetical protein [Spongospora subterranea]
MTIQDPEQGRALLPAVFSPDALTNHSSKNLPIGQDPFYSEYFLTQSTEDSRNSPSAHECLRFGRPNFFETFTEMRQFAITAKEKRIAVFVCGPVKMVDDVKSQCCRESKNGITFDVHSELFEF